MNASKLANAEKSFRILIMGLPGSGKTTLAEKLKSKLPAATHLNADEVRKAKAEALREAADILECHPLDEPDAAHTPNWLYDRAVEYETGDQR